MYLDFSNYKTSGAELPKGRVAKKLLLSSLLPSVLACRN